MCIYKIRRIMIDRALREKAVAGSETEMRQTLGRLRYKDALVFKEALVDALRKEGLMGDAQK